MPGKCLGAPTEGDKCCWRGHDKLETVNLRTYSPTGGLPLDTILYECWKCLTALMKRINKKWGSPPSHHHTSRHTHTTSTAQLFYCTLFDVPLFLLNSRLRFWSQFDFLWHIWYILWKQYKLREKQGVSKPELLQIYLKNEMTQVHLLYTKNKDSLPLKRHTCKLIFFPSLDWYWFLFKVVMVMHCHESLTEEKE